MAGTRISSSGATLELAGLRLSSRILSGVVPKVEAMDSRVSVLWTR